MEDSDRSVDAVREAHWLFGDDAHYFVMNVGEGRYSAMRWAYVYPVATPAMWSPVALADDLSAGGTSQRAARDTAEAVAELAGVEDATAVGDVGDPAAAIIEAAHANAVDVVAVASNDRGWLSRMFSGSVEADLLRSADFSVLVIK